MSVKYVGVDPFPCFFGFCFSEKDYAKEMKHLLIEPHKFLETAAVVKTFTGPDESLVILLCIDKEASKLRSKEQVAALIAHEAVHVVQVIKEEYSPKHDLGSETEAYLVQRIVQNCLELLWDSELVTKTAP